MITRDMAESLIRDQLVTTIFQDVPKQSVVLSLMRRLPNMTSKQTRVPVLDMLPLAYWVNGDIGFKQESQQAWENVYLTAAEMAVIVPIPEAVIEDASYDIIGEVNPRVSEAMGALIDSAIIFGVNRPAEWQNDIITLARVAGNNIAAPLSYNSIMGPGGLIAAVEASGYMVNGIVASMASRGALRGLVDGAGRPLFVSDMKGATPYALDGAPMFFPQNGSFDPNIAQMVAGAWNQAVYSIRQDITVKILDQGVIQDPATGAIVYNLAQQDMIALRVVMRMGWALPNPATRLNGLRTNVPFAYLEPAVPVGDFAVTFTVTDDALPPAPLQDARININGARLVTNAAGVAVANLRPGAYNYSVKLAGHRTVNGTVAVAGAPVAEAVVLPIIP